MKKWLSWIPIVAFLMAFAFMFAGQQFSMPPLTFVGLFFLGLCALVSGIQVIITREAFFLPTGDQALRRRAESYSGLAAQLWGVFFVLFGLVLLAASVVMFLVPQTAEDFVDRLFDTPAGWGLLLLGIGTVVALYGATRLLAGAAALRSNLRIQMLDLGYRFLGTILLFIGLALAGLGAMLLTSPETITNVIEQWVPIQIPRS